VPESPRFLVLHDDHQKALDVLIRLHHDPCDPNNTFAHQELNMIREKWEAEKDIIKSDGRWRLFSKKSNRQRLVLACLVMIGGQNIGPLVINNYNVLLYNSLGLGSTTSLLLSAVYNTVGLLIACIGGLIADRLGRRKCMSKFFTCVICSPASANDYHSHRLCVGNLCFCDTDRNDRTIQQHSNRRLGCCCHDHGLYLCCLVGSLLISM
jgi:hypothetical protein